MEKDYELLRRFVGLQQRVVEEELLVKIMVFGRKLKIDAGGQEGRATMFRTWYPARKTPLVLVTKGRDDAEETHYICPVCLAVRDKEFSLFEKDNILVGCGRECDFSQDP